jgi:hypothetical protein
VTHHIVELAPDLTVTLVDPNAIPQMWDDLRPLIEQACAYSNGASSPKDVIERIMLGHFRLVAFMRGHVPQSILVLHIAQFDTGERILEVLLASGSGARDWMKFEPQMEDYARAAGCSRMRMIGREGLAKILTDWKRTAIVLEKVIATNVN